MPYSENKTNKLVFIILEQHIIGLDIQRQLKKRGYEVQLLTPLLFASTIVFNNKPDFIITECKTKQTPEYFEKIKHFCDEKELPIIFISLEICTDDNIKTEKQFKTIQTFSIPFNTIDIVKVVDSCFTPYALESFNNELYLWQNRL